MGINIKLNSLKMDPNIFKRGTTTAARVFYKGLVTGDSDNPVSITLEAPGEGDPIFFRDGQGVEAKAIVWKHKFTTSLQEFFMDVDVVVDAATGPKTPCEITLTGESKAGGPPSIDREAIFHKA